MAKRFKKLGQNLFCQNWLMQGALQHTNQLDEFETGLQQRYVVERINGSLKQYHGLNRARYLGLAKMKLQTGLTCLAHNLKTLVKLWTGIGLRMPLTAHVS